MKKKKKKKRETERRCGEMIIKNKVLEEEE